MAYIEYSDYTAIYSELSEADFNRLQWLAEKRLDNLTTGVDGYAKLKEAFPDGDDGEAVKRCLCELIHLSYQIEEAENRIRTAQSLITNADGTVNGAVISSKSSGSESVSYAAINSSTTGSTLVDAAVSDKTVQQQLYTDTVREYLSGVHDANGVNVLYMGPYPHIREVE